jgi:hypothetical protein
LWLFSPDWLGIPLFASELAELTNRAILLGLTTSGYRAVFLAAFLSMGLYTVFQTFFASLMVKMMKINNDKRSHYIDVIKCNSIILGYRINIVIIFILLSPAIFYIVIRALKITM